MNFVSIVASILSMLFSLTRSASIPQTNLEVTASAESHSWQDAWEPHGPCGLDDYHCMNKRALLYVNIIRKQAKQLPLQSGTEAMLKEAYEYSRSRTPMKPKICSNKRHGRNFAQNHILNSPDGPTDPAMMCIQQFEDAARDYAKMVSKDVTHLVMGAYIDREGSLFCTQTFWTHVRYSDGMCSKARIEERQRR